MRYQAGSTVSLAFVAISCSWGCTPTASTQGNTPDRADRAADLTAVLPAPDDGPFAPARTRFTDIDKSATGPDKPTTPPPAGVVDGKHLIDVGACDGCHPDAFAQQQVSAHAFSSFNNPVYRFSVDRLRTDAGNSTSQMCGGCHDIALLVDRAMPDAIRPEDDRAHAGVTCRVCHGIAQANHDGNGSYALSRVPLPIPDGNDPISIERHKRAAAPIDGRVLCGSCHRSFLDPATGNHHFLAGQDELTAWQSSAYNQSGVGRVDDAIPRTSCIDCHMRKEAALLGDVAADEQGEIRSHRFLGGHTWLAAMLGDDTQLARQTAFLRDSVSIDIGAAFTGQGADAAWTQPADGAPVTAGTRFGVDVVIRNVRVGHRFPAGVRDAVDSWIEVRVHDARGTLIAQSGDDDNAHRLRALVGNRAGLPQLERNTHAFYEPIKDHTLAARNAQVVRYHMDVPATVDPAGFPWRVSARLVHRTRNLQVQKLACEAFESERGQAFARHTDSLGQAVLNPCGPQPLTEIAATEVVVGPGADEAPVGPRALRWKRLYEHGLGLLGELPREAPVARASLLAALDAVSVSAEPRDRAKILGAMGALYAGAPCGPSAPPDWPTCHSRYEEALRWLDQAEQLVPGHPALASSRAAILDRSFRWPQAADALGAAARTVPENVFVWRDYAGVLHSLGRHAEALQAARRGLALLPREDDLLRAQKLSLQALGADPTEVEAASAAYEAHRRAERPTEMQGMCADQLAMCEYERFTVHSHELTLVAE